MTTCRGSVGRSLRSCTSSVVPWRTRARNVRPVCAPVSTAGACARCASAGAVSSAAPPPSAAARFRTFRREMPRGVDVMPGSSRLAEFRQDRLLIRENLIQLPLIPEQRLERGLVGENGLLVREDLLLVGENAGLIGEDVQLIGASGVGHLCGRLLSATTVDRTGLGVNPGTMNTFGPPGESCL